MKQIKRATGKRMSKGIVELIVGIGMLKKLCILLIAVIISSCSTNESVTLTLENSSEQTRLDASIVISREEISAWSALHDTLYPVLLDADMSYIPSQVDDLDGDGSWDELFIVSDFAGNEIKEVTLDFVGKQSYPTTPVRTNIRFANRTNNYEEVKTATRNKHTNIAVSTKAWQMEGPAWENDYIAFRNYFDLRNGIDILGKVSNEMVLDKVDYHNFPTFHTFNPEWGMDVLNVGASLGAGSIAYCYEDSLYRVGDNGTGTYQIISEGPLRSIFRLEYVDWDMGGEQLKVIHDISIQAGTFYYESNVTYSGGDRKLRLVSGIVNTKSKELIEVENLDKNKVFYTHALQAEDSTMLGMGIMVDERDFIASTETPNTGDGIIETYCIHLNAGSNQPVKFRFYAVWDKQNAKWSNPLAFEEMLRQDAEFINNPLIVRR